MNRGTLICWISVNNGAAPLLELLTHSKSILRGKIDRLILCYRESAKELGIAKTIESNLRDEVKQCPEIIRRSWKTKASPVDHEAIRKFAEKILLEEDRCRTKEQVIYLFLSPGTPSMHAVWLVLGATGFIPDPVILIQSIGGRERPKGAPPIEQVKVSIDSWLRQHRHTSTNSKTTHEDLFWDPHLIKSSALLNLFEKLERYAPLRVPILLTGERGTGKTTIARYVRTKSAFAKNDSWETVVCGQFRLNAELARSELFGHQKGAFTGADKNRKGLLEAADGDSLFLDEVGDLDKNTQRALMAAVEGRGFSRLGETTIRDSDFRLISATNINLPDLQQKYLDRDFFDRIAIFTVEVPPLRACKEDLPMFWSSVFKNAIEYLDIRPTGWRRYLEHQDILDALRSKPLEGNFRDLQKVAYHLLASLNAEDSEKDAITTSLAVLTQNRPQTVPVSLPVDLNAEVKLFKNRFVEEALKRTNGNKTKAAKLLKMNTRTFTDLVRKLSPFSDH